MHAVFAGNHGQMSQILGNDIVNKMSNVNSGTTTTATTAPQMTKDSAGNVNTPASVTSSTTNEQQIKFKESDEIPIDEVNHWNGVIENETDYVPRQIISEVNENEQKQQNTTENDPKEVIK